MGNASSKSLNSYAGLQGILLRVVDLGILGILFLAPLFMGGRHPVGRLVFVAIVAVMSVAWFVRQCVLSRASWRSSAGQWIFLGGVVLLLVQLVPLSPELFAELAPDAPGLLPLWTPGGDNAGSLGTWSQLSMNPAKTQGALALLLAYGLVFLIIVQRAHSVDDIHRILRWVALAALAMAILGLGQYLTSNGKFLWTYEHPHRLANHVQGPFVNRNHFCHLLALGIGPCACWLVMRLTELGKRRRTSTRGFTNAASETHLITALVAIALGVIAFTALMTSSRGGIITMTVAIVSVGIVYYLGSLLDRRYFIGLAGLVLVTGTLLAIHGSDHVTARLDTLTNHSLDEIDRGQARRNIWEANWLAIKGSPCFGRGVGTHRDYYKIFLPRSYSFDFSHAENGYVQIAAETGAAGGALLGLGIGVCVFWCAMAIRRHKHRSELACLGAVTAALAASTAHSLVDFVWYIPACMSWTLILCGLACRLHQLTGDQQAAKPDDSVPRTAWIIATPVIIAICAWTVHALIAPALASNDWERYLKVSEQRSLMQEKASIPASLTAAKEDPDVEQAHRVLDRLMADHLSACLAKNPNDARVNLRLTATLLRQFQQQQQQHSENPMDLAQIRDAAIASRFSSREALYEWLDRAIGPHRVLLDRALWHARQAVSQCPLQGEGYLFLAELCFLEGANAEAKAAYVDQALLVRPHDGSVLLMAGKEAAIAGNIEKATEYWRQSFHRALRDKRELVNLLAGRIPAPAMLQILRPKADDWRVIHSRYQMLRQPQEIAVICDYFFTRAEQHPAELAKPSRFWVGLSRTYAALGNEERGNACAQRAFACDPETFEVRLLVATTMLRSERFVEAEEHLRWCTARRPDAKHLHRLLNQAVKGRIAQPTRTSALTLPAGSTLSRPR